MRSKGLTVSHVERDSIAGEMGVEPGDAILSINGQPVIDVLDYYFYAKDPVITIGLVKKNGEHWELEIEKEYDQDLGVEFIASGLERITPCRNKCVFCFVDQMPAGMRKSLYVKDDDYRLSFLQGSFITLTNITDRELSRIAKLRLSPLYVSVHTTNPGLRREIMKNPGAGEIMNRLKYLTSQGIAIHTQAVICPGINDGKELDKTVTDLAGLWPGVKSLAVVPVGLTGWRKNLFPLRQFNPGEAAGIVNKVREWQDACIKNFGYPFVFAGDEFYLLSGRDIPSRRYYADFPQTENGVGLTRLFLDEWNDIKKRIPVSVKKPLSVSIVTGNLGRQIMQPVAEHLNRVHNLKVTVVTVENEFFGPSVTVAGLLTGQDIIRNRDRLKGSDMVILPSVLLRHEGGLTLDGLTLKQMEKETGATLTTADGPEELVDVIFSH